MQEQSLQPGQAASEQSLQPARRNKFQKAKMVQDVYKIISEYAEDLAGTGISLGDDPKIIYERDGRCYMTIPGADLSALQETDICDVTDRSEEELPAAAALSRSKDLSAMIIASPPYTGICIESHHEIDAVLDDMAQIAGPKITIVSADEKEILRALKKASSVMIDSGFLIAGGRNLYEALTNLLIVEKSAEVTLKAQVIGGVRPLGAGISRHMHHIYQKKYSAEEAKLRAAEEEGAGQNAAAPDNNFDLVERQLREELARYGRMLVSTGLVQGTWGNISVRLDGEHMLCTPSGLDYERLSAGDMVKVNIKDLRSEGIHKPTSEKSLHAGIYREHPDAGAVIHTHSKYCSIFAASEMPLQVEDVGKIAKLGEIVRVTKYAPAGTNRITRNVIKAIDGAPGCIMAHHGMIAKGKDLAEAMELTELIEAAAREYIDRRWEK